MTYSVKEIFYTLQGEGGQADDAMSLPVWGFHLQAPFFANSLGDSHRV